MQRGQPLYNGERLPVFLCLLFVPKNAFVLKKRVKRYNNKKSSIINRNNEGA